MRWRMALSSIMPATRKRADERLDFRLGGLHVQHLDLVLGEGDDIAAAGCVEAFVALVNGREFHAADGAAAGLVALDPRVHGALIVEHLAFAGTAGGLGTLHDRTAEAAVQKPACGNGGNDEQQCDEVLHDLIPPRF